VELPPLRREILPPPAKWPLTPVDAYRPPMKSEGTCRLSAVLQGAGRNAATIASNLEKITATETIETVKYGPTGERHYSKPQRSYYVVSITEPRAGYLDVEESRKIVSTEDEPSDVQTKGLAALVVIFHPYYAKDFEMRCEGLTEWRGMPVWSVYFKQRPEKESQVRTYNTPGGRFPIPLKGRAFISASEYQIVRMETNLVAPLPKLRLEHEHLIIEYEPILFESRKVKLWLPMTAEFLSYWRGKVYHTRHQMNDYLLFNVDVGERAQRPKEETPPPDDPTHPN
jgi:hypothetical protein